MKKFISLLLILLTISCKNNDSSSEEKTSLFETSFSNYQEVDFLKDYEKLSDTSYVKSGDEPTHRITELKKGNETLILFSKVEFDDEQNETNLILDTLQITDLQQEQVITIGYCEVENSLMEEIIAVVENTENDTIRAIQKAWKANADAQKIERIEDLETIHCLNEHQL